MSKSPEDMLSLGLLSVCKELLGRVRVLEELVASSPDLATRYQEQSRFKAAFEEDEYARVKRSLREVLAALDEDGAESPSSEPGASDTQGDT